MSKLSPHFVILNMEKGRAIVRLCNDLPLKDDVLLQTGEYTFFANRNTYNKIVKWHNEQDNEALARFFTKEVNGVSLVNYFVDMDKIASQTGADVTAESHELEDVKGKEPWLYDENYHNPNDPSEKQVKDSDDGRFVATFDPRGNLQLAELNKPYSRLDPEDPVALGTVSISSGSNGQMIAKRLASLLKFIDREHSKTESNDSSTGSQ